MSRRSRTIGADSWPTGPRSALCQRCTSAAGRRRDSSRKALTPFAASITDTTGIAPDAEITLETNPDDVTRERADQWAAAGINRVSFGVQSHDPAVLAWMHRTHRAEQVAPAVAALRASGICNISADLIFALPAHLERDWRDDLERTIALEPTHLSLYGLTIEPHTPLFRWTERGASVPTLDERYADEYLLAHQMMTAAGFDHYEVSNAGRPRFSRETPTTLPTGVVWITSGSAHRRTR